MSKECIICKKESNETTTIRLNLNTSFCLSSSSETICYDCLEENLRETSVAEFIKIDGVLYYSINGYSFDSVASERHLDMIFNKEYYSIKKLMNS